MVEQPNNHKTVEGQQRGVDAESVETERLLDTQDGQAWETLREMGYESGDTIPLAHVYYNARSASTTSTTFTSGPWNGTHEKVVVPFHLVPSGASETFVNVAAHLSNDTAGETTTFQAVNVDGSTNIKLSATGTDNQVVESGWVSVGDRTTPTVPYGEMKVTGGTGNVWHPAIVVGVQL